MADDLTIDEAASLLNVRPSSVVELIDSGTLPLTGTEVNPRVRLADLLAYRDGVDAEAEDALFAMTAEAEDLGLYDK